MKINIILKITARYLFCPILLYFIYCCTVDSNDISQMARAKQYLSRLQQFLFLMLGEMATIKCIIITTF